MKAAYSRIAWGLTLELIDFRVQHFDLLPDILGYLLIMIGLSGLRPRSWRFTLGWSAAGVLAVLSIPRLIGQPFANLSLFPAQAPGLASLVASAVSEVVELVMMYGICMGIREKALSEKGMTNLVSSARRIWEALFGLTAVTLICFPFLLNTGEELILLMIGLAIASFVASLFVIALVRKAGRQLTAPRGRL